jgi:hypothetical protein
MRLIYGPELENIACTGVKYIGLFVYKKAVLPIDTEISHPYSKKLKPESTTKPLFKPFYKMKFILAIVPFLVAAVSALPAESKAQVSCEEQARTCAENTFDVKKCNNQVWSEYWGCSTAICAAGGDDKSTMDRVAHSHGC